MRGRRSRCDFKKVLAICLNNISRVISRAVFEGILHTFLATCDNIEVWEWS
jgi:hypothetical protein